jgi:EAL and modified HD-GYP domain-containing signal transduction protein
MTEKLHPGERQSADVGFTVGIMSLMDALFSIRMADILGNVNVLDEVRDALLFRDGDYGRMLSLIEHVEKADCGPAMVHTLDRLHLSPGELRSIQLAAFDWVNGYVEGVAAR